MRTFPVCGVLLVITAGILVALPCAAAPITVPNFSFETGGLSNGWTLALPNGGGTYSGIGDFTTTMPLPPPADADLYAFFEAPAMGDSGSISSGSSLTTILPNTKYTLTVALGHRDNGSRRPDDYLIELLANGTPIASNALSDAYVNITARTFTDLSASFLAPTSGGVVGQALTVRLTHSSDDATFRQGAFDNVRLDASFVQPVPEPSTMLLLSLGCLGINMMRRRNRS